MQRGNPLAQGGICRSFILKDIFMDWINIIQMDEHLFIIFIAIWDILVKCWE
jgi:hypothetical protein